MHYLCRKCGGQSLDVPFIAEIDLYKFDPWQLPGMALYGEKEWYFFSPRDRKYPNGSRPNRTAGAGYWKATGTDKSIGRPKPVGIKKALVFYAGKAPRGVKTNWIMHEYRLANVDRSANNKGNTNNSRLDDWVLCRIYNKKGKMETHSNKTNNAIYVDKALTFVKGEADNEEQKPKVLSIPLTMVEKNETMRNGNYYNFNLDDNLSDDQSLQRGVQTYSSGFTEQQVVLSPDDKEVQSPALQWNELDGAFIDYQSRLGYTNDGLFPNNNDLLASSASQIMLHYNNNDNDNLFQLQEDMFMYMQKPFDQFL